MQEIIDVNPFVKEIENSLETIDIGIRAISITLNSIYFNL